MEKSHSSYLRQSQGCLGGMTYELKVQFHSVTREQSWTPAINAYLCRGRMVVCVELAGVDKERIELHAEPRRLRLRGVRLPLESMLEDCPPLQMFALEIDQGFFQRELPLPLAINPDAVTAEQRNGMLWITLPLAP